MRATTDKYLQTIIDVVTGSDGGVDFAFFLKILRDLDAKAEAGDTSADTVIEMGLGRFAKFLDVCREVSQDAVDKLQKDAILQGKRRRNASNK